MTKRCILALVATCFLLLPTASVAIDSVGKRRVVATTTTRPKTHKVQKLVESRGGAAVSTPLPQPQQQQRRRFSSSSLTRQGILWSIPLLSTTAAFAHFGRVPRGFHSLVRSCSERLGFWLPTTDVEVDLQTQVVTQVVNGPVITSISLLFAALVSMTVSTLHNRQLAMRQNFAKLVSAVSMLQHTARQLPPAQQDTIQNLLVQLEKGLVSESRRQTDDGDSSTRVNEILYTILLHLQAWSNNNKSSSVAAQAHAVAERIHEERQNTQTLLATGFPTMHYIALAFLASSICLSFLVATDQSLHILESMQVRMLWSILIGSFTSLAVVCFDLSSPFAGAYKAR